MRNWAFFAAGLLFGLLLAIGFSGKCQDYIVASGLVRHLDGSQHCNNLVTPGVGYEHPLTVKWRLSVGEYSNSNCRESWYAAGAWLPLQLGNWKLGAIGGAVSGYSAPILPVGALIAAYEPGPVGFNLILIPPAGESGGGVLWAQIKFRW